MNRLKDKVTIVTGGSNGIGRVVANELAKEGANIIIADIRPSECIDEIRALGVHAMYVKTDVRDPESVNAMVSKVMDEFHHIDVLFNNAGICTHVPAEDQTFDSWKEIFNVNVHGVFLVAQAVGRVMIKQGKGSIINTASMSGSIVNWPQRQTAYNASKAAVIMLTKSLAVEWAEHNVRVNCISPGYIRTEMTGMAKPEWIEEWNVYSPLRRMGTPQELAGAVIYLAEDCNSFTTGSDFIIDGAYTAR